MSTRIQEAHVWLDDDRPMPDDWTHLATSSQAAIDLLTGFSVTPEIEFGSISFDYGLGMFDTARPVMLWMIKNDFWPKRIDFHTGHPGGRQWLVDMAQTHAPESVQVGR